MKESRKLTNALVVLAILCFGTGISLGQYGNTYKCQGGYVGCTLNTSGDPDEDGEEDCYKNPGTCQTLDGVSTDFDAFDNLSYRVGGCYPSSSGSCNGQQRVLSCDTTYYKRNAVKNCATPVCRGVAYSMGCPNPI